MCGEIFLGKSVFACLAASKYFFKMCNACPGEFTSLVVRKQRLVGLLGAGQTIVGKIHGQRTGGAGHNWNKSGFAKAESLRCR